MYYMKINKNFVHQVEDQPRLFLSYFDKNFNFLHRVLGKYTNIKFHENPSRGSRVVPCGQTLGSKDMAKLIFSFT